jgi:hypothetical protein
LLSRYAHIPVTFFEDVVPAKTRNGDETVDPAAGVQIVTEGETELSVQGPVEVLPTVNETEAREMKPVESHALIRIVCAPFAIWIFVSTELVDEWKTAVPSR